MLSLSNMLIWVICVAVVPDPDQRELLVHIVYTHTKGPVCPGLHLILRYRDKHCIAWAAEAHGRKTSMFVIFLIWKWLQGLLGDCGGSVFGWKRRENVTAMLVPSVTWGEHALLQPVRAGPLLTWPFSFLFPSLTYITVQNFRIKKLLPSDVQQVWVKHMCCKTGLWGSTVWASTSWQLAESPGAQLSWHIVLSLYCH